VIAKAKKGSDVKWSQLNARMEVAGEVGAYHMDVEGGADSAVFPMEDLADLLMQCRWFLTAIDPQETWLTADFLKEVTKWAAQYYYLVVEWRLEGMYRFKDALKVY
jgi:hypothetical protein